MAGDSIKPPEHGASPAAEETPASPGAPRAATRLDSLGTLVGGIAHEINNPITYVLTNLTDLSSLCDGLRGALHTYRRHIEENLGDRAAAIVGDVEAKIDAAGGLDLLDELIPDAIEGAERIRDVVRDLLSLLRPTQTSSAPMNVHEVLDSTLRLVQRELTQRGELERDYRATHSAVGDGTKLGQVILNLVTNAIHACEGEDRCQLRVRTRDRDDGIEIEIEDSGAGIPEEIRPRIFTPFFTTRRARGGTGLGLFLSREIIEQHRGILDFRCKPEGGTIFRIVLPQGDV